MYCTLCTRFKKTPKNGTGVWVTTGCSSFRYDKIKKHEQSAQHKEAEREKAFLEESQASGGISSSFARSYKSGKKGCDWSTEMYVFPN